SSMAAASRCTSACTPSGPTCHVGMWSSVVWKCTIGAIATPGAAAIPLSLRLIRWHEVFGDGAAHCNTRASSVGLHLPIQEGNPSSPMKNKAQTHDAADALPDFLNEVTEATEGLEELLGSEPEASA